MIRFVDLSRDYWGFDGEERGAPCCAFLDTTSNRFVEHPADRDHVFTCPEDVAILDARSPLPRRFSGLVPDDFWWWPLHENGELGDT